MIMKLISKKKNRLPSGRIRQDCHLCHLRWMGSPAAASLAAAIFLSDLPENDLFSKKGVLRFYHGEASECRVRYGDREEGFVTSGSYHPWFMAVKQSMPYCDYRFEENRRAFVKSQGADAPIWFDGSSFVTQTNPGGCPMGGYPLFRRDDPRRQTKYDTLLLQLSTENSLYQFFISASHLRKEDFSDILFIQDRF